MSTPAVSPFLLDPFYDPHPNGFQVSIRGDINQIRKFTRGVSNPDQVSLKILLKDQFEELGNKALERKWTLQQMQNGQATFSFPDELHYPKLTAYLEIKSEGDQTLISRVLVDTDWAIKRDITYCAQKICDCEEDSTYEIRLRKVTEGVARPYLALIRCTFSDA